MWSTGGGEEAVAVLTAGLLMCDRRLRTVWACVRRLCVLLLAPRSGEIGWTEAAQVTCPSPTKAWSYPIEDRDKAISTLSNMD